MLKVYETKRGFYVVAEYNEDNGQYTAPLTNKEYKSLGFTSWCAGTVDGLGATSYQHKSSAYRRLRQLKEEE